MKTWEMIKALTENPERKFRNKALDVTIAFDKRWGQLTDSNGDFIEIPILSDGWELVKEPVEFMAAAKAHMDGKTVVCEHVNFGKREYKGSVNTTKFTDNLGVAISADEILEGKWYIE